MGSYCYEGGGVFLIVGGSPGEEIMRWHLIIVHVILVDNVKYRLTLRQMGLEDVLSLLKWFRNRVTATAVSPHCLSEWPREKKQSIPPCPHKMKAKRTKASLIQRNLIMGPQAHLENCLFLATSIAHVNGAQWFAPWIHRSNAVSSALMTRLCSFCVLRSLQSFGKNVSTWFFMPPCNDSSVSLLNGFF